MIVQGFVAPGFEAVREEFAAVTDGEEDGYAAQLAVCTPYGQVVDPQDPRTWARIGRR